MLAWLMPTTSGVVATRSGDAVVPSDSSPAPCSAEESVGVAASSGFTSGTPEIRAATKVQACSIAALSAVDNSGGLIAPKEGRPSAPVTNVQDGLAPVISPVP